MYTLSLIFSSLFGLGIGSFLNVVILRVHSQEALTGRSRCPHCQTQLHWYELFPVLSFVVLGGRCGTCCTAISWQYPLVELITAALTVLFTVIYWGDWLRLGLLLPVVFILVVMFVYDAKYYLIPDLFSLPALGYAIIVSLVLGLAWWQVGLGIVIGGGLFIAQYVVSRGKWVGGGDIRLGAVMGACLGWPNILAALFIAYVVGASVAIPLLLSKQKQLNDRLPFGTFLAVATIASLLWGDTLVSWYVHTLLHL